MIDHRSAGVCAVCHMYFKNENQVVDIVVGIRDNPCLFWEILLEKFEVNRWLYGEINIYHRIEMFRYFITVFKFIYDRKTSN